VRLLRSTIHAALALLVASSAAAGGAAAATLPAEPDDSLSVSTSGVSFEPDGAVVGANASFRIRSLDESSSQHLRVKIDAAASLAGYVAFVGARVAMPGGYCVTYVKVPGVGEWSEGSGGRTCTAALLPTPTVEPTSAPRSEPTANPSPSRAASPTDTPTPTSDPSPSPSASASPSPSPSASPSPSPSAGVAAKEELAEQGRTLAESFSDDLPELDVEPGGRERAEAPWAELAIGGGAVAVVGGSAALWWGRRKGG
jgi:hypothetical protein